MKAISLICHPLLMASYVCYVLFIQAPELFPRVQSELIFHFIMVIAITTFVMPAISIYLLRTFRYISSLELGERKERIVPFIFIAVYYFITAYLFWEKLRMGPFFIAIISSAPVLILILLAVTTKFKISIHAAAIWFGVGILSSLVVFLGVSLGIYLYIFILAAGLTSSSRLYLSAHSPREVWSGTVTGFLYGFAVIGVFAKIL